MRVGNALYLIHFHFRGFIMHWLSIDAELVNFLPDSHICSTCGATKRMHASHVPTPKRPLASFAQIGYSAETRA